VYEEGCGHGGRGLQCAIIIRCTYGRSPGTRPHTHAHAHTHIHTRAHTHTRTHLKDSNGRGMNRANLLTCPPAGLSSDLASEESDIGTSSEAADLLLDYMQDEVGIEALQGFTPEQMDRALTKVGRDLIGEYVLCVHKGGCVEGELLRLGMGMRADSIGDHSNNCIHHRAQMACGDVVVGS